jgi:hypothetical protein
MPVFGVAPVEHSAAVANSVAVANSAVVGNPTDMAVVGRSYRQVLRISHEGELSALCISDQGDTVTFAG